MRICGSCNQNKQEDEFNKKGKGYQSQCKICQRLWYKGYYDSNPKEKNRLLKRNRSSRKELRQKIIELKSGVPCVDCAVCYPHYVMDFDHINDDKEFNVSNLVTYSSWEKIEKEVQKCELVCANCHRERTYKRMQSPLV